MNALARPALVAAICAAVGCQRDLAGAPCPCADGYRCEATTKTCYSGPETQLIDDMRAPDTETGGYWYTYSDRTVSNSAPVVFLADAAGSVQPTEGDPFLPVSRPGDPDAPVIGGVRYPYRLVEGGGEAVWGVGFGADFSGAKPDGGPVPVNECDAGVVFYQDAEVNIPQPFDGGGWTGIQFYARSFSVDTMIQIHIDDDRTSPWGLPIDAGGCNACFTGWHACSDSFTRTMVIPAGGWSLVQVAFASMHSGAFADLLDAATPIHQDKLYNLHLQVPGTAAAPAPSFSLGVAYVSFYK